MQRDTPRPSGPSRPNSNGLLLPQNFPSEINRRKTNNSSSQKISLNNSQNDSQKNSLKNPPKNPQKNTTKNPAKNSQNNSQKNSQNNSQKNSQKNSDGSPTSTPHQNKTQRSETEIHSNDGSGSEKSGSGSGSKKKRSQSIFRNNRTHSVKSTAAKYSGSLFLTIVNEEIIYLNPCDPYEKFLEESVAQYELLNSEGDRIFYAKEVQGDGSILYFGGKLDATFHILTDEGRELLKIQGYRGNNGLGAHYLIYQQESKVGEILQTNNSRYAEKTFMLINEDDKCFGLIEISQESTPRCGFLCHLLRLRFRSGDVGTKAALNKSATYNVIGSPDVHILARVGRMSLKIPTANAEIEQSSTPPTSANATRRTSFGVQFVDNMNSREKEVLLASLFI